MNKISKTKEKVIKPKIRRRCYVCTRWSKSQLTDDQTTLLKCILRSRMTSSFAIMSLNYGRSAIGSGVSVPAESLGS